MNEVAYQKEISRDHFYMNVFIDPYNKRLRIDDYRGDVSQIINEVEEMVIELQVEKLIFIGRREHFALLLEHAFQCEVVVDYFFGGSDAYFFTKYFSKHRKQSDHWMMEDGIIKNVSLLSRNQVKLAVPSRYVLKKIGKEDAESLAILYRRVFQIYPTPLHDSAYIQKTIDQGTIYFGFIHEGNIVSAASAEVNSQYHNAELTDCATLTNHRKFGLMKHLLERLEVELKQNSIFCSYSIARAQSFGMNAVLHQLGYTYRGRLMNNCYIFDKLENMNMWVKDLSKS